LFQQEEHLVLKMTKLNYKTIGIILVIAIFPLLLNQAYAELTFASVVKSANQTVVSSTVLQDDDELKFVGKANSLYSFQLQTIISGESGTNMKTAFTVPTGTTMKWHPLTAFTGGLTPFVSGEVGSGIREERLIFMSGTDPDRLQLTEIYGTVKMGSTSGTVQFQWSQNFASATPATMFEGSSLRVYEVGATQTGNGTGSVVFAKVVKSVDETVNNSSVKQDDDELKFTCNADTTYSFQMYVMIDSITSMQVQWTLPSGATGEWVNLDWTSGGSSQTQSVTNDIFVSSTGGNIEWVPYAGRIIVGSTGGTCNFQWAQNSPTVGDTKVVKGSSLIVWEEGTSTGTDSIGLIHTKVTKATDDTVNNSIVFVNDSELFFIGDANKSYSLTLMMLMSSASNADLKMDWTLPSGATGQRITEDFSWFFGQFPSNTENITDEVVFTTNGQDQQLQLHANINMGSTGGIVNFQFAQVTAQASDTKMLKGTTLLVYEEGTSTLSDIQGEQGQQGIQGIQGEKGDKGSAGSGGGSVGSVPAPAPAPATSTSTSTSIIRRRVSTISSCTTSSTRTNCFYTNNRTTRISCTNIFRVCCC